MRLSTRTRYGTRILIDLALHHESRLKLEEIARRQQLSHSYLKHVISPLVNAGIIGSTRGNGGGIWLQRTAPEIKLGEVARLLEGTNLLVDCLDKPETCTRSDNCLTRRMWKRVELSVFDFLDSLTLQDLLADGEGKACQKIC